MPSHLKALIVILGLATVVFASAKTTACAVASTTRDFERRRNLWFGITLVAFLAHNFWIFIIITAALLLFLAPRDPNKLALFYFLLFAVPPFSAEVSGLGVIRYFFEINYLRLLALMVLLPAFLSLRARPDTERFGRLLPDKLLAGYLILQFLLMLTANTFTNTLRVSVFYAFIDVFLPYYVASRSLKNLQGFRDALMAFVMAALVLSAVGAFEFTRHWLLYSQLDHALGVVNWTSTIYLPRGETLRAVGSTGQPIPLGYLMAVAVGFLLCLRKTAPNPLAWRLGGAALMVGLIVPMSRGPWVGATAMLLVFIATDPYPGKGFVKYGLLGLIFIPVVLVSPAGKDIINSLPFVGTLDAASVTYRQRLVDISIDLISDNPLFGAFDYMYSPAMAELKQGEGFIDLVNTYMGVGLSSGLVGLSLFSGFFIVVALGIFKGMRNLGDRSDELYLLGQGLFSVLLGILVIIFTVSSISIIPVIYWSVAGLGVAYARMLASAKAPVKAPVTVGRASLQSSTIRSGSYFGTGDKQVNSKL